MKLRVLLRDIHHWAALLVALPVAVMIGAGVLLMLKKEVGWIQPPTQAGVERSGVPTKTFQELFEAARAVPQARIDTWADLDRVDVKPGKGVVKFVAANRWEVQVDTHTGKVLQAAYRRSDLIESIHDGSFFADWAKLYVFLPAGVVLFVMWATGMYLFILPHWKRRERAKRRARERGLTERTATNPTPAE